jgi:ABC-2 type transport system permease protein
MEQDRRAEGGHLRARQRIERVLEMMRKEFYQLRRDPRLLRIVFVAPMIQLVVFGYAVTTDIRHTPTFVVDLDHTQDSRELIEAFTSSGYFRITGHSDRPADLVRALDGGGALVGIEIPRGFSEDLRGGSGARVQILVDGTDSNTATVAMGYAERIVQSAGARLAPAGAAALDLRERSWFNPDLTSRNYNVPAVLGIIIMLVCLLLTSLAVVREREIGTLEQLMVSPLSPAELIAGKTLPFALIGIADLVAVTTVAFLWFGVPFAGSFLLLFAASLLYILAGLGMGLFVSTISHTQQEAFMVTFLLFMPSILLSGFMFPVSSMPPLFQWLTLLNPIRHYLEIVRGVFLKGAGPGALVHQLAALLLLGGAFVLFAGSRFRKTAS